VEKLATFENCSEVDMRIWKLPSNVDTDALAPGAYMKQDIANIATHCLELVRPEFASQVQKGDVIVAGANFGIGSSREQAASVLVQLGVAAVIAPSYSGLYFRNAFNVGLLLLTCSQANKLRDGEALELIAGQPFTIKTQDNALLPCAPVPQFLLDMVNAGGLLNKLKADLQP
jgi:3-isopropylmalate/(R)-2-methylmalate dehydratase small subunit